MLITPPSSLLLLSSLVAEDWMAIPALEPVPLLGQHGADVPLSERR